MTVEKPFEFVSFKDFELFNKVIIEGLLNTKKSLLIGTYNLQNIRINIRNYTNTLSGYLIQLVQNDIVALIIMNPFMRKSQFINTLRGQTVTQGKLSIRFCERIHLKTVIVDFEYAYIGSANITGAGVGMKSLRRRNFELGFITRDRDIIVDLSDLFMEIYNGKFCSKEKCIYFKNPYVKKTCNGILWNVFEMRGK